MIFDEFPIVLPFYDDKGKQNRYKENVGNAELFDVWALNDKIIPFQFRHIAGSTLVDLSIINEDGSFVTYLDLSDVLKEDISGFKYFTWLSDEPFQYKSGGLLDLACGKYYIQAKLSDSTILVSEVFSIMRNQDEFFLLEWFNETGDIDPVYYGSGFKNRLYSNTFITKGVPTIELETERDGYGNTVVISRRMITNYDFSFLITPNFIVEAVNFMSLHDSIFITTKQGYRSGEIENVSVDQDQIQDFALWEITIKFNQPQFYFNGSCSTPITPAKEDTIVINTGTINQEFDLIYDAN